MSEEHGCVNTPPSTREQVTGDILTERELQEEKFPDQRLSLVEWGMVLAEEFGEFSQEVVTRDVAPKGTKSGKRVDSDAIMDCIYEELVQVAAVTMRILENIRNGRIE